MLLTRMIRLVFLVPVLTAAVPAQADVMDDVLERGTLRVGVSLFAPWTMESQTGGLIGFEIDLADQLATDMGVEPDFHVYVWEDIIDALRNGEIDMIAGGMAITPARALRVDFTRPYAESGVGLAANISRTRRIDSLEDLDSDGVVITVTADTLANDVARRVFRNAELRVLSSNEEAESQLLDGSAHAYVASMPEVVFLALRHPDTVDLPLEDPLLASSEALAVRKGEQQWLNFLNAWIESRKADRWITATRNYWFRTLDWADQVAADE